MDDLESPGTNQKLTQALAANEQEGKRETISAPSKSIDIRVSDVNLQVFSSNLSIRRHHSSQETPSHTLKIDGRDVRYRLCINSRA
ncbi:hypothetical protein RRG08_019536 [Elysia crispata]|uniref:Uncharacterized protein n=1 Tax=Elysia crispata TaxID=231223 RepID=A0AAE1D605_9GAST|nr:hypothetical protein RRG08_019536 [Elysia crispata]